MKIAVEKVNSNSSKIYDTTEEFQILHMADVGVNSNKFYCIELQKNKKNEWQIFTNYGRLKISSIYEVRKCNSESQARNEFKRIINSKIRKGYFKVDVVAPTVGSINICVKTFNKKNVAIPIINTSSYSENIIKLINQLRDENIHSITSTSSIEYSINKGFETPLGPVTKEHVIKARFVLNNIKELKEKKLLSKNDQQTIELNNNYLSLIPHNFGRVITDYHMILEDKQILKEFDLLDQLETAVNIQDNNKTVSKSLEDNGLIIKLLDNQKLIEYYTNWYEKTKSNKHPQSRGWKVHQIYEISIEEDKLRWDNLGNNTNNHVILFHGSRNCNILSILLKGLLIPPYNASHVTGRLFGNGIYGADKSTKALNYSIGWWANQSNKYDNSFLFITEFAMGNIYYPNTDNCKQPPKGYDSIHAKSITTGLLHDEYIVYKPGQTTIHYLVELKK